MGTLKIIYKICLTCIFCIPSIIYGQDFQWAQVQPSNEINGIRLLALDASGNTFIAGTFSGNNIDFDPGPNTYNLSGGNSGDIYITKFDMYGDWTWTKKVGNATQADYVQGLTVDPSGNIYVTGSFTGTVDFDPGIGTNNLISAGGRDGFILKLDNNGDFIDAKRLGGTGNDEIGHIKINSGGNIICTIMANGVIDIDFGPGIHNTINATNQHYVCKYSSQLNIIFSKPIVTPAKMSIDNSDNIYFTGSFVGTLDFDPGPNIYNMAPIQSSDSLDAFVLKLNQDGNFKWARQLGGSALSNGAGISIDDEGNVYTCGNFRGTIDMDPGPNTYPITCYGSTVGQYQDVFISKLDSLGGFIWGKRIGGTQVEVGNDIIVDNNGNAYITGRAEGITDFDPGANQFLIHNSIDQYILKLNTFGNFVWFTKIIGENGAMAIGRSLAIDNNNNIYNIGYFSGITDFDPSPNTNNLSGSNGSAYIYKLSQTACSNITIVVDSITNVNCNQNGQVITRGETGIPPYNYVWNTIPQTFDSILTISSSGIYTVTMVDNNGCTKTSSVLVEGPENVSNFDLDVNLLAQQFRPGFTRHIFLNAYNTGCVPVSGELKLVLGSYLTYLGSTPIPDAISGDTLIWNFTNLAYDSSHIMPDVIVEVSNQAAIGDSIYLPVFITPTLGDIDTTNNMKYYQFPVVNGYDPNDKQVYPLGDCGLHYIDMNEILTYTIRFQNTGNADAINIYIMDSLSNKLDINSVKILGKSHPMHTEILSGNRLKFVFNNIHLPDSNSNEPDSHGYVIYEAMPLPNLIAGTTIKNRAKIYFDYNAPIITNTVFNTISNGSHLSPTLDHIETSCTEYMWNGQLITQSGLYTHVASNLYGCDSVSTLHLTLAQPSSAIIVTNNCNNYTLNGQTYTSSGTYVQNLINNSGCDSTLTLELTINNPVETTFQETACDSYILNGQIYTTSGSYIQNYNGVNGCDSILNLQLIINETPNISVSQSGVTLSATGNANFQWINCNTNTPIQGAVSNTYTATQNGEYALVYEANGCADTSICFQVFNIGILEYESSGIKLFPNPTDAILNITTIEPFNNVEFSIYNAIGQLILKHNNLHGNNFSIDVSNISAGVYFINIQNGAYHQKIKFVKR